MKMVHVIGGNLNSKLMQWLKDLSIYDFIHVSLETTSIAPLEIQKSAVDISRYIVGATAIITVGTIADRMLTSINLEHGALPSTNIEDKKLIDENITKCRQYLLGRIHGKPTDTSSTPSCS